MSKKRQYFKFKWVPDEQINEHKKSGWEIVYVANDGAFKLPRQNILRRAIIFLTTYIGSKK